MFYFKNIVLVVLLWTSFTTASVDFQRAGWLDRVVEYYKQRFFTSVKNDLPPIEFKAKIIKAPPNYVDSDKWDYDSALRLLTLIRESEHTQPVAKSLNKLLNVNGRRLFMTALQSRQIFKTINKYDYYDSSSYEDLRQYTTPNIDDNGRVPWEFDEDNAVVQISNPVEARLPSAQISVRMLREILEARADAARIMPSTTQSTIPWIPMNKTAGNDTSSGNNTNSTAPNSGDNQNATADNGNANGTADGNATNEENKTAQLRAHDLNFDLDDEDIDYDDETARRNHKRHRIHGLHKKLQHRKKMRRLRSRPEAADARYKLTHLDRKESRKHKKRRG